MANISPTMRRARRAAAPLAFNGVISFWMAFFTWFFWIPSLSYFIIQGDPAAASRGCGCGTMPVIRELLVDHAAMSSIPAR